MLRGIYLTPLTQGYMLFTRISTFGKELYQQVFDYLQTILNQVSTHEKSAGTLDKFIVRIKVHTTGGWRYS